MEQIQTTKNIGLLLIAIGAGLEKEQKSLSQIK